MNLIQILNEILDGERYAEYVGGSLSTAMDNEILLFHVGDNHTVTTTPVPGEGDRIHFKQDEAEEIKYLVAKCYLKYKEPKCAFFKKAGEIATAYELKHVQTISKEEKHLLENLKDRCNKNLEGDERTWKGQTAIRAMPGDFRTPLNLQELSRQGRIKIHQPVQVFESDPEKWASEEILQYTVSITKLGWETR